MRRGLLAFAIALIASSTADADVNTLQTFMLPNGLRVYVEQMPAGGNVNVAGSVELSPAFDPPGKAGTGVIATALLPLLSLQGPAGTLPAMLATMAGGLTAPQAAPTVFRLAVFKREASVRQATLYPAERAQQAFDRAIFGPADPQDPRDAKASLDTITLADVRAYDARYITPQRTTLVIAGDIDRTAVQATVAAAFGGWPKGPDVPLIAYPVPPATARSVTVIPSTGTGVQVQIGQTTVGRANPSFYALNLINAVLDARLQRRVPGAHSALKATSGRGMLVIDAEMAPSNVNAGRAIVKAEVARLRRVPIPLAEWNAARKRLLSSSAVTDPSVGAEIARIQNIADHHLPLDYYARLAGVYKATPQDGLRAAHTYLTDAFAEVIVAQHRRGRAGLFHAAPISARQTCLKPYVNVN